MASPVVFQPSSLEVFCAKVVKRHSTSWPPSEQKLADEFCKFFGSAGLASFDCLVKLCDSLGIAISFAALPRELRGYHYWYEEKRGILIAGGDHTALFREHTVFHELREMLEHTFRELGYPTSEPILPESQAEEFATCARWTASLETWLSLLDGAQKLQSKWGRRGAYALIGIGALAYGLNCLYLPSLEDHLIQAAGQPT